MLPGSVVNRPQVLTGYRVYIVAHTGVGLVQPKCSCSAECSLDCGGLVLISTGRALGTGSR